MEDVQKMSYQMANSLDDDIMDKVVKNSVEYVDKVLVVDNTLLIRTGKAIQVTTKTDDLLIGHLADIKYTEDLVDHNTLAGTDSILLSSNSLGYVELKLTEIKDIQLLQNEAISSQIDLYWV